jgi:hypothetical protein
MGRVIRVLLIIAVLASLSFSFNLRYKGYLEGNLLGSETTYDETPYLILSQRTSLFTRLDLIESLSIEARPVLIEYINPNKETGVFDEMTQLVGEGEGNLFNLQKSWTTEDELSRTSLILSRLNMELDLYPVVITVGRQRIDWGVGLIYRPLDVFNPSESISIRRGELGFSDALNAEFFLGGLSSAQVSFLPYRGMSGDEFDLTGKISTTVKSYDINLHFAYLRRDILAGA